ncbi:hypothetical protein DFH07DRAFT_935740 [Mycena maculata]|uniref:Uncharacterized protein n=1 Tax=Mycena maculata TaxID=230809 RepID=A0AAD7KBD8_9AGAR|nr:hypothetical protein DFH07DRAFT_935740 [Mycena maculata]
MSASKPSLQFLLSALPSTSATNVLILIVIIGMLIASVVCYASPTRLTKKLVASLYDAETLYHDVVETGVVSTSDTAQVQKFEELEELLAKLQLKVSEIRTATLRNSLPKRTALAEFLRGASFTILRCLEDVEGFKARIEIDLTPLQRYAADSGYNISRLCGRFGIPPSSSSPKIPEGELEGLDHPHLFFRRFGGHNLNQDFEAVKDERWDNRDTQLAKPGHSMSNDQKNCGGESHRWGSIKKSASRCIQEFKTKGQPWVLQPEEVRSSQARLIAVEVESWGLQEEGTDTQKDGREQGRGKLGIGKAFLTESAEELSGLGNESVQAAMLGMVQGRLSGLLGRNSGYAENLPREVRRKVEGLKGVQVQQTELQNWCKRSVSSWSARGQRGLLDAPFVHGWDGWPLTWPAEWLDPRVPVAWASMGTTRGTVAYIELQKPLYARRHAIIGGDAAPTTDEIAAGEPSRSRTTRTTPPSTSRIKKRFEIDEGAGDTEGKAEDVDVKGIPDFWLTALRNHPGLAELITDRDAEALAFLQDVTHAYLPFKGEEGEPGSRPRSTGTRRTRSSLTRH